MADQSRDNAYSKLIVKCLSTLQALDAGTSNDHLYNSSVQTENVAERIQELGENLSKLVEAGNEMNELALRPVPLELFDYIDVLDSNAKNPANFENEMFETTEKTAAELADRILYIRVSAQVLYNAHI